MPSAAPYRIGIAAGRKRSDLAPAVIMIFHVARLGIVDQLGLDSYSIYLVDHGAPVGYRLAAKHPDRVESLIVQNGNAYDEGLLEFWDPIKAYWADRTPEKAEPLRGLLTIGATKWQCLTGVRDSATISPLSGRNAAPASSSNSA